MLPKILRTSEAPSGWDNCDGHSHFLQLGKLSSYSWKPPSYKGVQPRSDPGLHHSCSHCLPCPANPTFSFPSRPSRPSLELRGWVGHMDLKSPLMALSLEP